MVDPVTLAISAFVAVTGGLRLIVDVKEYLEARRERKMKEREKDEQEEPRQIHISSYNCAPVTHPGTVPNPAALGYASLPAWGQYAGGPYLYPPPAPRRQPPPAVLNPHSPNCRHYGAAAITCTVNSYCSTASWIMEVGGRVDALAPSPAKPCLAQGRGLCTGRDPNARNSVALARCHWLSFQQEVLPSSLTPTMAVVHWESGQVDVFVEAGGVYYLNYQVAACRGAAFASKYRDREVFSGQLAGGRLVRCNRDIRFRDVQAFERSANSWVHLGLVGEDVPRAAYEEDPVLVEMVGGAVFGLVCALYTSPWQIDVRIEFSAARRSPRAVVRSSGVHSSARRRSCVFSVFAFNAAPWTYNTVVVA